MIPMPNWVALSKLEKRMTSNLIRAEVNTTPPTPISTITLMKGNPPTMSTTAPNKFVSFLDAVGRDFMKGLAFVVKYLVPVESLAALLFPPAAAALTEAEVTASLLQQTILTVEQNYAAAGVQSGTGAQKASAVLTLVGPAVTNLLAQPTIAAELTKAGITVNADYIQNLINAVVGFLNVQAPPTA